MRTFFRVVLFILLTVLTQIGGVAYLLTLLIWDKKVRELPRWYQSKVPLFVFLYLMATFFIVPALSPRIPLPMGEENGLRPVTVITCLLNRNYVDPELYEVLMELSTSHPYTLQYMDANFPFWDGFPLLPHLSHNDGEKIDLAFQYGTGGTDLENLQLPTFLGYGSFELPYEGENDMAARCQEKGAWQYSMCSFIPRRSTEATFHHYRTKQLIKRLIRNPSVKKIFIEPHLKTRLGLVSPKVCFHGCHAVRHDDHIHVEL